VAQVRGNQYAKNATGQISIQVDGTLPIWLPRWTKTHKIWLQALAEELAALAADIKEMQRKQDELRKRQERLLTETDSDAKRADNP
jgi:hypothetical protein